MNDKSNKGGKADKPIALPPPPLHVSKGPGTRHGAEVIAERMDGEKVRGGLQRLDEQARLVIKTDDEFHDVPFSKLRVLTFLGALPEAQKRHPIQERGGRVLTPQQPQRFSIVFRDGKVLSGRTWSLLVDEKGLHLFQVGEGLGVVRRFVPFQVIKDYHVGLRIGEALVDEKLTSNKQVGDAVRKQQGLRKKKIGKYLQRGMALTTDDLTRALQRQGAYHAKRLGDLLLDEGLISRRQLDTALAKQQRDRSKKLGDILVEMGAVSVEALHITLALNLGIPFARLRGLDMDPGVMDLVSADLVRKHLLLPLFLHDGHLIVAMADPTDVEAINLLRFITGRAIEVVLSSEEDVRWAIERFYGLKESEEAIKDLGLDAAEAGSEKTSVEEIERMAKEKPMVRLVNGIIIDAIRRRASDIHIRAAERVIDLFYRIDGTLMKARTMDKKLLSAIVSRVKILGRMDIAERRLPQDGRTFVSHEGTVIDLRISVMPTVLGESVVIRILDTRAGLKDLSQIGFSPHDGAVIADLLHKSYGLVLVTGPTGSGKSTTLYAALGEIRTQNVNIITVEDPVEYHIDGIEQIQAYTAPGLSFAEALRHILRHDPDVIMIGEIRDRETSKIAIESALTGHLVLSTLHTNNAAAAVTRLMEMGVEPYLLSATLLGVLAQRLVRRNCEHCTVEETVDDNVRKGLGVTQDEVFYRGEGCDYCNNTGYNGRVAVYELLLVTEGVRDIAVAGVTAAEIHGQAVNDGMTPLTESAMSLARRRVTSLAEAYRVRLE